jgi:D-beta-D-heptose 7-phosphate kinase/D-beta-D-heptose 1-phosphate adenosyltransferase
MTPNFSDTKVLVIGDIMIDKYLNGQVSRISPEAPVPVVNLKSTSSNLGGAANVAANLIGLKVQTTLIGALGNDDDQDLAKRLCSESNIDLKFITRSIPTITKTRVLGGNQQIVRIDNETVSELSLNEVEEVRTLLKSQNTKFDGIILSDYGKGFCSNELSHFIIDYANQNDIPLFVDPKGKLWDKYKGATYITPNFKEFCDYLKHNGPNDTSFIESESQLLLKEGLSKNLLITRSEKGMSLCSNDGFIHINTKARNVFDVSGAGDTVIASLAAAISSGWKTEDALELANKSAGIVVGQIGTVPIEANLLDNEIPLGDSLNIKELQYEMKNRKGQKSVFTNGCFDLLHRGHLDYLKKARQLGDYLIVGLNSDSSVSKLKGPERPINKEEDRATLLSALEFVDYVVIFSEDTPAELLSELKPNTLVKGGDYTIEQVIGKEYVDEVALIDFVEGYSSTKIIKKIMDT